VSFAFRNAKNMGADLQASHIGVLLYFLTGLLPDPDGPWSPSASHCHSWAVGALTEFVIAALFMSERRAIHVPDSLLHSLFGIGVARIALLVLMMVLMISRHYHMRPERSSDSERTSLLENGDGHTSNGYGASNGTPKGGPKKLPDAQSAGWYDYLAGFRILFPYLW